MFRFLWPFRQKSTGTDPEREKEETLAACEAELRRIKREPYGEVSRPKDIERRLKVLESASRLGLSESPAIRRLAYLHRLLNALAEGGVDFAEAGPLIREAQGLDLQDYCCVSFVDCKRHIALLESGRPLVHSRARGRPAVYWRGEVYFKNRSGSLEIRKDGISFKGEVIYEVAWKDAKLVTDTTRTIDDRDYDAVSIQEEGRKTATLFLIPSHECPEYVCKLAIWLWERSGKPT